MTPVEEGSTRLPEGKPMLLATASHTFSASPTPPSPPPPPGQTLEICVWKGGRAVSHHRGCNANERMGGRKGARHGPCC